MKSKAVMKWFNSGVLPVVAKTSTIKTISKKRDKNDPSLESAIQKTILEYLAVKNIMHWRNNTGGTRIGANNHSKGYFMQWGSPGSPDILCILKPSGRFCGIEVKSTTGKQSDLQKKWQQRCEENGGLYILARSLDDVIKHL